mmetsp:Transcript_29685/g.80258  ORF Transcript_29685/g.80258 Transcript_29685/m.80258 type:complete len:361 (-) Transcript_29685:57-1139(-)
MRWRASSKPDPGDTDVAKPVLHSFCDKYVAAGYSRYFELKYSSSSNGVATLHITAKPEPWTLADVQTGIALLHEFECQDIGEFVAVWDLRCLVMPTLECVLLFTRWMKAHASNFKWRLAAGALIICDGIWGYVARAAIRTLTTVVPTSGTFCVCFSEDQADKFLKSATAGGAPRKPGKPAAGAKGQCHAPRRQVLALVVACCSMLLAWLCPRNDGKPAARGSASSARLALLSCAAVAAGFSCIISLRDSRAASELQPGCSRQPPSAAMADRPPVHCSSGGSPSPMGGQQLCGSEAWKSPSLLSTCSTASSASPNEARRTLLPQADWYEAIGPCCCGQRIRARHPVVSLEKARDRGPPNYV